MNCSQRIRRYVCLASLGLGCASLATAWTSAQANSAWVPAPARLATSAIRLPGGAASVSARVGQGEGKDVCGAFLEAVSLIESAGNPNRIGRQGERGLMQLRRRTWDDLTSLLYGQPLAFDRAFEPDLNRRIGEAYLQQLQRFLRERRGRWKADERTLLLACYNAGPARVEQAGFSFDGLPATTRDYVTRAAALHDALVRERSHLQPAI